MLITPPLIRLSLPDRLEVGLSEPGKSDEYLEQRAGAVLDDVRLVLLEDPPPRRRQHLRRLQVVCVGLLKPPDPLGQFRRGNFARQSMFQLVGSRPRSGCSGARENALDLVVERAKARLGGARTARRPPKPGESAADEWHGLREKAGVRLDPELQPVDSARERARALVAAKRLVPGRHLEPERVLDLDEQVEATHP